MVNGREGMLTRIRKALGQEPAATSSARVPSSPGPRLDGVMAAIAPGDLVAKFETEFGKVAGLPHQASTGTELEGILRAIIDGAQTTEVVLTRNPLLGQTGLQGKLRAWGKNAIQWTAGSAGASDAASEKEFRDRCFSAGIGISGVDFALAETGSLVLSSQTEGCQLASLAPPIHVALYRRSQIFGSLDEILERMPLSGMSGASAAGRSIVFITGPSRTADIEQILIRGVHGPREVHAILVEDSCLDQPGLTQT
jgi:L-lactate utilization protein LutC